MPFPMMWPLLGCCGLYYAKKKKRKPTPPGRTPTPPSSSTGSLTADLGSSVNTNPRRRSRSRFHARRN
jgi:hypothetical protein